MQFFKASGTAFFAGGLSLVSQIVGLRIITREVSASELTVASVLICALCGLSIGALISGRIVDRRKNRETSALKLADFLLFCAAVVALLFALLGQTLASRIGTLNLSELLEVVSFLSVTVLPVNILLGGIVPVLTQAAMARSAENVRSAFGWIYAWETLGAATGSWVVVFLAIPSLGTRGALIVAALIALAWVVLGMLHWILKPPAKIQEAEAAEAAAKGDGQQNGEQDLAPVSTESALSTPLLRWLLLGAALVSSCASLGMELVWQRYFAVIFGSDSHSYAVVATIFLAGNAIGAALSSRTFRFQNANSRIYQWQLLLIAGAILASAWSLGFWFRLETMQWALGWLERNPLSGRLLMAMAVLLLPAVLIGSALPVLVKVWSADRKSVGTRVGQIYAFVIVGNVVGILLCAAWLIPVAGLRVTAVILAAVCAAASVGLGFAANGVQHQRGAGRMIRLGCYWGTLAGIIGLAVHVVNSPLRPGIADNGTWIVDHYVERASHTVAVTHASELPSNKRLMIDGVTIGESGGGVDEKQQVLAHLPFVIGDAKRANVLTIGLGTGILAGELVANHQVDSVTCVELSSAVIEASDWFREENRNVLQNEKLNLVHGDGVHYLRKATSKFDVIVSDGKSRPGAASNLPFFSQEYYRICADALSEQGVFVQWVSLRCDENELNTILKTFCGNFPYGHIAIAAPDSVYLVGTGAPISFDTAGIEDYLNRQSTEQLKSYSWAAAEDFLSMYWLDQALVGEALSDVAANTFDRPVLENYAWESYGHSLSQLPTQFAAVERLLDRDTQSLLNGQPIDECQHRETVKKMKVARKAAIELMTGESIRVAREENWLDRATVHFKKAAQQLPNLNRQIHIVEEFRHLARSAKQESDVGAEYSALINISELGATTAGEEHRMAVILDQANQQDMAVQHYYKAAKLSGEHPRYLISLGESLLRLRKYSAALVRFDRAIERCSNAKISQLAGADLKPLATLLKGIALQKLGRRGDGDPLILEALKTNPELQDVYQRYAF